jgi:hypothetical protein
LEVKNMGGNTSAGGGAIRAKRYGYGKKGKKNQIPRKR